MSCHSAPVIAPPAHHWGTAGSRHLRNVLRSQCKPDPCCTQQCLGEPRMAPPGHCCIISPMRVVGYEPCRCGCGRQELLHVAHLTGGLAWECFRDGRVARLKAARVQSGTAIIEVKLVSKRKIKRVPKRSTNAQLRHAARCAAWKRLAKLCPEIYDVVYADECHARGLPIVPKRVPFGAYEATVATNEAEIAYSAVADQPGDPDADTYHRPT